MTSNGIGFPTALSNNSQRSSSTNTFLSGFLTPSQMSYHSYTSKYGARKEHNSQKPIQQCSPMVGSGVNLPLFIISFLITSRDLLGLTSRLSSRSCRARVVA